MGRLLFAAFVILVVLVSVLSLWAHFKAPCSVYQYSVAKDTPGRCLVLKN